MAFVKLTQEKNPKLAIQTNTSLNYKDKDGNIKQRKPETALLESIKEAGKVAAMEQGTVTLSAAINGEWKNYFVNRMQDYSIRLIPIDDSKNKDKIIYVNSFKTEEGKYFYAINTKQEAGKTFVEGLETNTSKDGQSSYIKANIRLSNENIKQDLLNKGEQAKDYVAIVSKDGFHVVLEKDLTHQLQKDQAKHMQQDMQSEKVSTKKQDKGMER